MWQLGHGRLQPEHISVVARARAIYLGDERDDRLDRLEMARAYAAHVIAEIERLPEIKGLLDEGCG